MRKYDCHKCVNRGSPLCDLCTLFEKPSGNETKPKYYIAQSEEQIDPGLHQFSLMSPIELGQSRTRLLTERLTNDEKTEAIANYLIAHLLARVPVPTAIVLEYNRKTEKEE